MVEKTKLDQLIWNLLRGFQTGFKTCEIIQEGISYTRAIPKSFWLDEEKGYYGILGLYDLTKKDLWALDDGKSSTFEFISNVAWYSAEAVKENSLENAGLLSGRRHTFC